MDKALKDWTPGEMKAYCDEKYRGGKGCDGCPFDRMYSCMFLCDIAPVKWDLVDSPAFTEQDVEDAKVLMRAFPYYNTVMRDERNGILRICNGCGGSMINEEMFPPVKPGESIKLREIAEYRNDD